MLKFIKNYLTQPSTFTGIFKMLAAFGLFTITPELQDVVTENLVMVSAALIALFGVYDTVRNERKD